MAAPLINTRYEIVETLPAPERPPFVVSKARDRDENRVVTLEVLPASPETRPAAGRAAFLDAAREAERLDHPNIARVYESGEAEPGGDLFVASEYLHGITLRERIRRVAPFSLTVTADIAVAVAEALDYAHRQNVVHGALRPQTVFLSPEGQIKVLDFAYARAAADLAGPLPAGEGTVPPSPVLGRGAGGEGLTAGGGSVADDVYALGALLYEMLAGAAPLTSPAAPVPSPRALNPGIPPALDGIVQKALQPDPAARYRSAALLLADLQAVRDALRTGRSLAWSPLNERRAPRQPVDATMVGAAPAGVVGAGTLSAAADELEDERPAPVERDGPNWLGRIAGILFVILVLGVIGLTWYFSKMITIPNDVVVPNLVGKTMDEAHSLAGQKHFTLEEGNSDYSDQWPENQIYQQDPPAGRSIKAGQTVTVARSLGPRLMTVPRLIGGTRDFATTALKDANLPVGAVTENFSDTVPKGNIISQNPQPGARVDRNTAVNYIVSQGRQPPEIPGGVEATATAPDKVEVRWRATPRADTYTVTRSLDGNETVIARGITDTRVTDTGLNPDTTYTYTVNAANAGGDSGPSDTAAATTPARVAEPPTLPTDVTVTPPDQAGAGAPAAPPDTGPARMRQFHIPIHLRRHPSGSHRVQIMVQDATGNNLAYDEMREAGSDVDAVVTGFGNKITFRVFLDGKLVKQQTL